MVIVWRLRGNIIRTVIYIGNVLPLQWAQLTKTVYTARLGLEFVFLGCIIYEIRNSLMKYASNVRINKSQTSLQKRDNE